MALDRSGVGLLRKFGFIALTYSCFLLASTLCVFGQVDEGSITGVVQDTSGAVVPNAQVSLLNTDQGITLEVKTNADGVFTFSPVRIGHYSLSVVATGFAKTTQQNLTVNVAQRLQVNIQLKPGTASETVEVSAAPPLLQTQEASVGQVMTEKTVVDLPLNGRNFTFLAQLGAGTQTPQADTRGNAASGAFSANGLRPAQNNYLLDGIDNNSNAVDFLNGTNYVVLPPVDAISEFKVQTANFSAELGRSAGAVLNATIKSGTNSFHGAAWEFFRNDKLDAADWFENNAGIQKGRLRLNQFGASIGGPIIRDKIFFFGDYEGLRRVQGTVLTGTVPTAPEVASGFTNLSDLITLQSSATPTTDNLGRAIALGSVLDPATTRQVIAGTVDSVSGIAAKNTGFVRDPFGCPASTTTVSLANCPNLNHIPAARLDPVALNLMSLYPGATTQGKLSGNYTVSPSLFEQRNAFDVRADFNPSQKDQVFFRFSYVDNPNFIPGIFGGVADGGAFQQGDQTAKSNQSVVGYTHVFTPATINVLHVGFNHLHTTRFGPVGNQTGIPATYGIKGVPQFPENGGLPSIAIGGLSTLGSNAFLPSDEHSQTLQITNDFTKVWRSHNFKAGIESQHVKFSTLQPAYSRGNFDFDGRYSDVPEKNNGGTGRAQFLLTPTTASVANGVNYSGGADGVNASNINTTYNYRTYLAFYFQDDWKINPRLTVNLGLRWDYFSPIRETNGGQANFVQSGPPNNAPTYLIPASGKDDRSLSTSFTTLLAKDGIALQLTDQFGQGLVQTQKTNFAPRLGLAFQINPKLVLRGGFGFFFNSFENQGYGPNIGENYPFVFNFSYSPQVPGNSVTGLQTVSPISFNSPWTGCATAGPGGTATISSGLSCINFSPTAVNAQGLGLQGLQFHYITPRTLSVNTTLQYSITRALSAQIAYVFTQGRNLQQGVGNNNVTALLPAGSPTSNTTSPGAGGTIPFPDFAANGSFQSTIGSSNYNGLQTKLEQQFYNGLTLLFAYTYSKTMSDAGDLLNGGSATSLRAPAIAGPGFGPEFDWGPAIFDIRHVVHLTGTYDLPIGTNKRFLGDAGKVVNALVGGWSVNSIIVLQGGQPVTLACPSRTVASNVGNNGCNDIRVAGQSQKLGLRNVLVGSGPNPGLYWYGNPAAFSQPQPCTVAGSCSPALLGFRPGTTVGPGFHRWDFSLFKQQKITERFTLQFRSEFFNIVNHPNFNAPNFGGNGVVAISNSGNFTSPNFGRIGSTRDAPYDPRQIQFALKLLY